MRFRFLRRRGPGTLSLLYNEARLAPHVRKGLNCMMAANICGAMCGIICAGGTAAMVGLAGTLGATDIEFGLLVSIPQIAACLQLPFSLLVNRTHKRKIWLLTFGLVSRMLWLLFGFMPLMMRSPSDRMPLYLLIALLSVSSCLGAAINVCWFPWFSDLAPIRIRGRWLGVRDKLVSIASFLFGLLVAYMLDVLPENSKYLVAFLVGGALGSADMICFAFAKEEFAAPPQKMHLGKIFGDMLRNKPYLRLLLMWTVWCFTANMSGSYITPYAMNTMGLNFMQMMVFGTMAASLATIVAVPRWGRALDQCGARNVMLLSCFGAALTQAFYLFATPGSIWPTLLHNVIGALFWSGSNLAANGMQLSTSPDDNRPTYIAIFSAVTCILGTALGTMTGGTLLEVFHTSGLFTGFFDRYKALILLGVVLRFTTGMLLVRSMERDSETTVHDVVRIMVPRRKRVVRG